MVNLRDFGGPAERLDNGFGVPSPKVLTVAVVEYRSACGYAGLAQNHIEHSSSIPREAGNVSR
jgi:hypothetical protein